MTSEDFTSQHAHSPDSLSLTKNGFLIALENNRKHPILEVEFETFETQVNARFEPSDAQRILEAARATEILHRGHVRRNGADYFTSHLLPVATLVDTDDSILKIGALMHDVVEDKAREYVIHVMGIDPDDIVGQTDKNLDHFVVGEVSEEVRALIKYAHEEMFLMQLALDDLDQRFGNGDGRLREIISGMTKVPFKVYATPDSTESERKRHRNEAYYRNMLISPERDTLIRIKIADFTSNLGSSLAYFPVHPHTLKYAGRVDQGLQILQPDPTTPNLELLKEMLGLSGYDFRQGASFRSGDLDWKLYSGLAV